MKQGFCFRSLQKKHISKQGIPVESAEENTTSAYTKEENDNKRSSEELCQRRKTIRQ